MLLPAGSFSGGQSGMSCRACLMAVCWRPQLLKRGLVLLSMAAIVSLLVPGAPLSRLVLSEDAERQRLLSENELRLQQSQRFLEQYRARSTPPRLSQSDPFPITRDDSPVSEVGITVLTMARGRRMGKRSVTYRTQYLTQSVARMLELLNDTSLRRSYSLHVCNIDDRPEVFAEARELEDLLPVFKRYGDKTGAASKAPKVIWEKLKMDYVYCLQQTLARGVRYALLVEDDAVAHVHLFRVLEHVLESVLEAPEARPVAYLKLYHPQRLLGYISLEVERLAELLALAVTLGAVLTLLTSRNTCHDLVYNSSSTPPSSLVLRWAGWAVVVAVLALAVGRTNLLEFRRLSPQLYQVTPTPSCCIPAVLYPRAGAEDISRFLLNVTCTAKRSTDIRMDEFRQQSGVRALQVQPNLFSHIGLVSSLRTKEVNPLIVQ